ncbi:MAG: TIGR00730 family Rossman fold protein [Pirellulales bacterium]
MTADRDQHRHPPYEADENDALSALDAELSAELSGDAARNRAAILASPSYRLAHEDTELLDRDELRPVRLMLELLKPELALETHHVTSTIVVFGSTQIADADTAARRTAAARRALTADPRNAQLQRRLSRAERLEAKCNVYDAAREFARLVSQQCQNGGCQFVVTTGGGPGIMEAANRGAYDVGAKTIGLNIMLPAEQSPNPYITPDLCFQFRYFAIRKMHFLLRAKALVVFPGGFGTLDELFDALTLRQTHRMQQIPIVMYNRAYWERVIDFQFLADEGTIADAHLELINYAESPEEAWEIIRKFAPPDEALPG